MTVTRVHGGSRKDHGMRLAVLFGIVLVAFAAQVAHAHEMRPAYLGLRATTPAAYEVTWKQPVLAERWLSLKLEFAPECKYQASTPELTVDALIERGTLACASPGLAGRVIGIGGLQRTLTDVLVRICDVDASCQERILRPDAPTFVVPGPDETSVGEYFRLGLGHLLGGLDHVLFVLALSLLVTDLAALVKIVTAFTVAHSVTLALSVLGVFHVAQGPVEALIAFSVAIVARDVVLARRQPRPIGEAVSAGFVRSALSTERWPLAFAFGLLHGLGFAGVLRDIGLPEDALAWSLLSFNIGIEAGQLLIVVPVYLMLNRLSRVWPSGVAGLMAPSGIAVGGIAAFWFMDRVWTIVIG